MEQIQDNFLSARATDLAEKGETQFISGPFLSPAEQITFYATVTSSNPAAAKNLFFFGGALDAERRKPVFVPDRELTENSPLFGDNVFSKEREEFFAVSVLPAYESGASGIIPVKLSGNKFTSLSHRACMGSILALGLKRESLGDIYVKSEREAIAFADAQIAEFIAENLEKVGNDTVRVFVADLPADYRIIRKYGRVMVISASDRVDAVAAALSGKPRSLIKSMCESGNIELNYFSGAEPDKSMKEGDVISVRGSGKFRIVSFDGYTKNGKLKISADKFI